MLPNNPVGIDDDEIIFEHFSYADFADGNAGYVDEFLGIGKRDKLKKAEKKQAKAVKQLEKGHIKAAERKGKKAEKLFTEYKTAQDKLIANQESKQAIGANKDVLNATDTRQTENPTSTAGQIGDVAGAMSSTAPTGGGSGGGELPYYPDAANPIPEEASGLNPGETSTVDNPTELEGVTVVGHPKKDNTIIFIIGGIVVLFLLYKFVFKGK